MQSFLSLFQVPFATSSGPSPASSEAARSASQSGVPDGLVQAFASASQTTGLPFDYFLTTARRESSLDANAAARTSSARGAFQFIEQTWLGMIHEHGQALGLGSEASAVERRADGRFVVSDPATKQAVLDLRYDPQLSAVMSGLYLQSNAQDLQNALGRPVTVGEGYVAHVFGPAGGSRLIALAEQQPGRAAADVFPTQARANPGLFYDRAGQPVSMRQLYDRLVDGFPQEQVSATAPAMMAPARASAPVAAPSPSEPLSLEPAGFAGLPEAAPADPDVLARHGLFTASSSRFASADARQPASDPFFKALFRADGYRTPDLAQEIVGTHGEGAVPPPTPRPEKVGADGPPVDLVQFVQSSQLAASYRNPARETAGTELVDPV